MSRRCLLTERPIGPLHQYQKSIEMCPMRRRWTNANAHNLTAAAIELIELLILEGPWVYTVTTDSENEPCLLAATRHFVFVSFHAGPLSIRDSAAVPKAGPVNAVKSSP